MLSFERILRHHSQVFSLRSLDNYAIYWDDEEGEINT